MFTNNFINLQRKFCGFSYGKIKGCTGSSASASTDTVVSGLNLLASMKTGRCSDDYSYSGVGVRFGSGSEPAALSDYALKNPINSGLSITNPASVSQYTAPDGSYVASATFTVINTSAENITIAEIGLFTALKTETYQGNLVLMERTVLDEPITIAPQEGKVITYKMTFRQTQNVE